MMKYDKTMLKREYSLKRLEAGRNFKITINPEADGFYHCSMGEVVVTDKDYELRTGGLTTCSAMAVVSGKKRLLSHVLPTGDAGQLSYIVRQHFNCEDQDVKMYKIPGDGLVASTEYSEKTIDQVACLLGMGKRISTFSDYRFFMHDVVLGSDGTIFIDEGKTHLKDIIAHKGMECLFLTYMSEHNILSEQVSEAVRRVINSVETTGWEHKTLVACPGTVVGPAKGPYEDLVGLYKESQPKRTLMPFKSHQETFLRFSSLAR